MDKNVTHEFPRAKEKSLHIYYREATSEFQITDGEFIEIVYHDDSVNIETLINKIIEEW